VSSTYRQKPRKQEESVVYTQRIIDIQKDYDDAGIEYIVQEDDRQEMDYEDAARLRPDTVQEYVTHIYRIKTQKRFVVNQASDEALIYYKRRSALRYNGAIIEDHRMWGYRMKPIGRPLLDEHGRVKKVDKTGETPYFTIPFKPETVDKLIENSLTDVDQFYIAHATTNGPGAVSTKNVFQILNKSDFKEGTFPELWDMARLDYTSRDSQLKSWRLERDSILKQAKNFKSISSSTGSGI
jgi:hypothetical protein